MKFDRKTYFDAVKGPLFGGKMDQGQVDGQNFLLDEWEKKPLSTDLRHLAYALATTKHETASTMLPIEEYGKGSGMSYGSPDPETKQTYYGRGFVQLTWRDNYARATDELDLEGDDDLEWHAARALDGGIAARVMYLGMEEGWFRGDSEGRQTLSRYFDVDTDDPFMAREIINGDKNIVPTWSHGVPIGQLIADYHQHFLDALSQAAIAEEGPDDPDFVPIPKVVTIRISVPAGVEVRIEETHE